MMPSFDILGPFNIQDVYRAPDMPGLYVWYAHLNIGKADWHADHTGGEKAAQTLFLRALQDHSMKIGQQRMSVQALTNFSTVWKGSLEEDATSRWRGILQVEVPDNQSSALASTIQQNHTREALMDLVSSSFPVFYSPLYLGRAVEQTLKKRLIQHKETFLDLWERYSKDREIIDRIDKPKSFGERAIKLGFSPEDLFCYTLTVSRFPDEKLMVEEINALIIASEWILNRWATPILGRQ